MLAMKHSMNKMPMVKRIWEEK